jgi:hypothetical protein
VGEGGGVSKPGEPADPGKESALLRAIIGAIFVLIGVGGIILMLINALHAPSAPPQPFKP